MDKRRFQRMPLPLSEDAEETAALQAMGVNAREYIEGFTWCPQSFDLYLAYGAVRVIGLFLAEFEMPVGGSDKFLWVVVGDLPSAYFVTDDAPDAASALTVYCSLMQDWVDAVLEGKSLSEVFPVAADASEENADLLQRRLDFLKIEVIPTV